ncbi:MAG: DNA polymerase III subunit delta [Deltaproteobacteria bacterium]|nr:DNA polymerase III subunit delta [Deltaproteobacteria bacterium]
MTTDLRADISRGQVAPVYVLSGDDHVMLERVISVLRDAVVPPSARAFNLDVLEARAVGPVAILNAARTLPMMGKKRLILARDVDALAADSLAELIPYLENPAPSSVLVLTCAKADGRLKFFAKAKQKGFLHQLEIPRQIGAWIRDEARQAGARMTEEAVRRLADVAGRDLGRLSSAIDQLALFAGDKQITAEDVDELVAETRERTVFELTQAVGDGNRERALRAVGKLVDQRESAIGMTLMLARHFRQLALVRELVESRTPERELPRIVGAPPFAMEGLLAQAKRFPARAIPSAFRLLARADRDLKGPVKGALGEQVVVERLVDGLLSLAK